MFKLTLKKSIVEPDINVPYWTSVWYARSLADLIGVTIRSTVKNAAKFAVYEDIKIKVKNHQTDPTIRPDIDLGDKSHPCCMKAPNVNQKEFEILNSFTAGCEAVTWPDIKFTSPFKKWVNYKKVFINLQLYYHLVDMVEPFAILVVKTSKRWIKQY